MELITERDRIREAIVSFRERHGDGTYGGDSRGRQIGKELAALDPETVSVDVVNEIIGNGSWTRLSCDDCGSDARAIIRVGQEPDYESRTADLCLFCARRAFELIARHEEAQS